MSTKKINNDLLKLQIATGRIIQRYRLSMRLDQHEVGFIVYGIPAKLKNKNAAQQRVKMIETGKQALRVTDLKSYAQLYKIKPEKLFEEILKESSNIKDSDLKAIS